MDALKKEYRNNRNAWNRRQITEKEFVSNFVQVIRKIELYSRELWKSAQANRAEMPQNQPQDNLAESPEKKDATLRDARGNKSGQFDSDGYIKDEKGHKLGRIENDGTIR